MHDEIPTSSEGILRCLQALAEETASLDLKQTNFALQRAINICRAEGRASLSAAPIAHTGWIH